MSTTTTRSVFVVLLACVLVLREFRGAAADDVLDVLDVTVPCGVVNNYSSSSSSNGLVGYNSTTRFLLQNCTSSAGTVIYMQQSHGLLSNISIVVEHSRWVAILIEGTPTTDLSGVTIWLRNVSDVSHESIRSSRICTAAKDTDRCLSVVSLAAFRSISDLNITMMDVLETRNETLIGLSGVATMIRLSVLVDNATIQSAATPIAVTNVSGMVSGCVVSLASISFTVVPSFDQSTGVALVLLDNVTTVQQLRVFLGDVTVVASPWDGAAAVVSLQDISVGRDCAIEVHGVTIVLPLAVGMVDTLGVVVSLRNATLLSASIRASAIVASDAAFAAAVLMSNTTADNLDIHVADSVCVVVQLSARNRPGLSLSGVHVVLRNMSTGGGSSSVSSLGPPLVINSVPLLQVLEYASLTNITIDIANVALTNVNTSAVASIYNVSRITGLHLQIANVTVLVGTTADATAAVATLYNVLGFVNCTVLLQSVHVVSLGVGVGGSGFFQLLSFTDVGPSSSVEVAIRSTTCATDGAFAVATTITAVYWWNVTSCVDCAVTLADVNMSSVSQHSTSVNMSYFGILVASSNITGNSFMNITNISVAGEARMTQLQNSTMHNVTFAYDNIAIASTLSQGSAVVAILVAITAVMDNCSVVIHRASLSSGNASAYVCDVSGGSLVRSTAMTFASITVAFASLFQVAHSSVGRCTVVVDSVHCASRSSVLLLDSLITAPMLRAINITVVHSNFSARYPIRVDSCNITQLSLSISTSTFNIVSDAEVTGNQYNALFFTNGSLTASTISLDSTNSTCSGAVTPPAAQVVRFLSFLLLGSTNVSIVIDAVKNSGGIAAVWSCVVDGASSIDIRVLSNITVVPSFIRSLVYVYLTTISNSSSVQILLPQGISMATGTSWFAPLFIDSVTLLGASRLLIAPVAAAASLTWRVNCVVSLVNTIATSNSSVSIQGLTVATTSSTLATIANCRFSSSSQLVVSAMRLASTSAVNALGLAFNSVIASGGASVGLQLSCGISRCVTVYDNVFTAQSSLLLDLARTPGYTSAATITYSEFDDSLVHVSVPAIATPTSSAALAVSIVGSYFSLTSLSAPQQLLVITPPGGTDSLRMTLYLDTTDFVAPWAAPPQGESGQSLALFNASAPTLSSLAIVTNKIAVIGLSAFVTAPSALLSVTGLVSSVSVTCSWWGRHLFTGNVASLHVALRGTFLRRNPHSALEAATKVTAVTASRTCGVAYDNGRADGSWTVSSSPSPTNQFASTTASSSRSSGSASLSSGRTLSQKLTTNVATLVFLSLSRTLRISPSNKPSASSTTQSIRGIPPYVPSSRRSALPPADTPSRTPSYATSVSESSTLSLDPPQGPPAAVASVVLSAPIATASIVATIGAIIGGELLGDAATIAMLSMMTCAGKATWDSNTGPQRLVVSVLYDFGPGASILGNLGLAVLVYAVQRLTIVVKGAWSSAPDPELAAIAALRTATLIRFPHIAWSVCFYLLPGVVFSAVSLFSVADDRLMGPSVVGRSVFGGAAIVLVACLVPLLARKAARGIWPRVRIASALHVFQVPFLPRHFLRWCGPWLLPKVMWVPTAIKNRHGSAFSSVASVDALWVHPLLQIHGAIFSTISSIPFPQDVCYVQFVLGMVWMCVPIGLVLWWRLRLLMRPPANVLLLASSSLSFCVLLSSFVLTVGPEDLQQGAATTRDALSWMVSIVSIVSTILTLASSVAEFIAWRNWQRQQRSSVHRLSHLLQQQQPRDDSSDDALRLIFHGSTPSDIGDDEDDGGNAAAMSAADVAILDARIEHLMTSPFFTSVRERHFSGSNRSEADVARWEHLRQLSLTLLVTRATQIIVDTRHDVPPQR